MGESLSKYHGTFAIKESIFLAEVFHSNHPKYGKSISGKYMYLLLKRHIGKFEVEIQIYLDTWVNYPSRGEASCGDQDFLAL